MSSLTWTRPHSVHSLSYNKLRFLTITKLTLILKQTTHQNKTSWKPANCIRDTNGPQKKKLSKPWILKNWRIYSLYLWIKHLKKLKMVLMMSTNEINYIFKKAAYISELKKKGKKTVRKIPKDEKWFDSDFKTLKKNLDNYTIWNIKIHTTLT